MKAIAQRSRNHDIWLLLNDRFAPTVEAVRADFANVIDANQIRAFNGLAGVAHNLGTNTWRIQAAEKLRARYLAELKPDIVYTASVAEGLDEDAIASNCPQFHSAATIYDLIPYTFSDVYLQSPVTRNWYYRRLQQLKSTDTLLAISEFTRQDTIERLHVREHQVFNISAGVDPSFKKLDLSEAAKSETRARYQLDRSFVMYTGGVDFRKNLEGLIRAYGALPADIRQSRQLAIVCSMSPTERTQLLAAGQKAGLSESDLVLTGYVPHDDLVALYNMCELFVFPSISEGFGLPVLEAMACGAPVIGSNCSSIPEVVGHDDALFDPLKSQSITAKLAAALTDLSFQRALKDHGARQHINFNWERSADRVLDALEQTAANRTTVEMRTPATPALISKREKPKLAFVSPVLPKKSGIATYASELLPDLAKHYDIDLIIDQTEVSDPWLLANFPCHTPQWFADNARHFDRIVYQMGNSSFHAFMFDLIDRFPGVVALHDFYLSGVAGWMDHSGLKPGHLNDQLFRSHGFKPLMTDHPVMKFPANKPVLDAALGLIVHSHHSLELSRQWYGEHHDEHWRVVPQVRAPSPSSNRSRGDAKNAIGLPPDAFLVCCFGILDATKQNELLLNAFMTSELARSDKCYLIMVGESSGEPYLAMLQSMAGASMAASRIQFTGFVDDTQFNLYLKAADIAVQLRQMSRGETSRTALDAMSAGVPLIVNSCGSMQELPDDCVVKLTEHATVQDLRLAIEMLWLDGVQRNKRSSLARDHIRTHHHPTVASIVYRDAIEEFYAAGLKIRQLDVFAHLLDTTGSSPTDIDVAEIASAVAQHDRLGAKRVVVDLTFALRDAITSDQAYLIRTTLAHMDDSIRIEPVIRKEGMLLSAASLAAEQIAGQRLTTAPYRVVLEERDTVILVDPPLDDPNDERYSAFSGANLVLILTGGLPEPGTKLGLLTQSPSIHQIVCKDPGLAGALRNHIAETEAAIEVIVHNSSDRPVSMPKGQ